MLGQPSDLDLRLIRVFLAVVDANGITPAQATLNVSQSTISTQLQRWKRGWATGCVNAGAAVSG